MLKINNGKKGNYPFGGTRTIDILEKRYNRDKAENLMSFKPIPILLLLSALHLTPPLALAIGGANAADAGKPAGTVAGTTTPASAVSGATNSGTPGNASATTANRTNDLSAAIDQFNAGHYPEALALFHTAKYDATRAAEAHYYKGCCLAKLQANANAIKEFKLAKLLDKTGNVSPLATKALEAYGEATTTDKATASPPAGTAKTNVDPPHLKDCAKRITNQAEDRINRVWRDAKLPPPEYQYSPFPSGSSFSGPRISSPFPSPFGFPPVSPTLPVGGSRYKFYQYPAGGRMNPYYNTPEYAYHKQRAKNVADSAEGLVSLLTRHDDGKGVYLVPQGTNLYVRNYEYGTSIDPVLTPLRTDMKMLSAKRLPAGTSSPPAAAGTSPPPATTEAASAGATAGAESPAAEPPAAASGVIPAAPITAESSAVPTASTGGNVPAKHPAPHTVTEDEADDQDTEE